METLIQFIFGLDPISLVLGGIIGALLSTWLALYVTRPRLKCVGSGGGGGSNFVVLHARVQNVSGFLGMRIQENIWFGRRINRTFEWGLRPDRQPARQCSAQLIDKKTGKTVGPLLWSKRSNPPNYSYQVDIAPDEQVDLIIFAGVGSPPKKMFRFQPKDLSNSEPIVPDDDVQFNGHHDFYVKIFCHGRCIEKFTARLEKDFNGRLQYYFGRYYTLRTHCRIV
jgi:hypothetical protein